MSGENRMKTRETRKMMRVSIAIFFISMTFVMMIFALNLLTTDWNKVSEEFKEATSELVDIARCDIQINSDEYSYSYKGLCDERLLGTEILEIIQNENKESLYNESNQ